jgi:arylsulfatase A-like enzyme
VADLADLDDYMPYLRAETGRPDAEYFEHGVGCNSHLARPWDKAEYLHPTNFVASRCVDYIAKRKNDRRPFFLFCSWHRPHPPYDPPQWAFDLYDRRPDLELPPRGEWSRRLERYATGRPDSPYARLKPRELRRARSGYYGLMTQIDYQVDRIIEALVDAGKDSDTLLVFVSDHGELLGDHDLFRKSLPYEGSARIPLIFNGPGIPRGSKISGVASLQDLMPTLLDYLGIPIPRHVDGLSLMPMIRGEKSAVREFLHGEHAYEGQSVQFLCDGEWKYIWWSGDGHEELFNRRRDPQELEELSASEPERVAILRAELAKRLVGRPEGYSDGAELFAGRDPINVLPWAETGMPS